MAIGPLSFAWTTSDPNVYNLKLPTKSDTFCCHSSASLANFDHQIWNS